MDSGGSGDLSLFVDGSIYIESLQWLDSTRRKEEAFDKWGVDEVSSGSTVYESGSGDSSCSVF